MVERNNKVLHGVASCVPDHRRLWKGHLFVLLTEDPTEDIVRVRRGERPRRKIWSRGSVQLGTRSICSLHTAGTATGCKLMLKEGHYGVISATF